MFDNHKKDSHKNPPYPNSRIKQKILLGSMSYSDRLAPIEHCYETKHIHLCSNNDIYIARNKDNEFITYWKTLTDLDFKVVEVDKFDESSKQNLSEVLLKNQNALEDISKHISKDATVVPFSPTGQEEEVASKLKRPLWGSAQAWSQVGKKSSLLKMAKQDGIEVPCGFHLSESFSSGLLYDKCSILNKMGFQKAILKSDLGIAGRGHWPICLTNITPSVIDSTYQRFRMEEKGAENYQRSSYILEGWVEDAISIGCYLNVYETGESQPVWYWQQLFSESQTEYLGAIPIALPASSKKSLISALQKVGTMLSHKGFYGSFGPDFLWLGGDNFLLLEVNARLPATAYAYHTAKLLGHPLNQGFYLKHIRLPGPMTFTTLKTILIKERLLIQDKNSTVPGLVPINYGLLDYGEIELLALAETNEQAKFLIQKAETVLSKAEYNEKSN